MGRTRHCLQEEGVVYSRLLVAERPWGDAPWQKLPSSPLPSHRIHANSSFPAPVIFLPVPYPRTSHTCRQLCPEDEHPHQEESSHRLHAAVSLRGASVESWGMPTFKPLGRMGVGSWAGQVLVFVPFSFAIALCFLEAFCTRYKWDYSIAQKAAVPLHNCPLQTHLGLRDKPRGDGLGHHPPSRLEAVELLSAGQVCLSRTNHCGDRAVFPSVGPLCGFPFYLVSTWTC